MSLLDIIKEATLHARKEKKSYAPFLITVCSECQMVGKNDGNREPTDEETIKVLRKFKAGAEEMFKFESSREQAYAELALLNAFLPTMLTKDELRVVIENIIPTLADRSISQMKTIMSSLKATHAGLFDGKDASDIAREFLK